MDHDSIRNPEEIRRAGESIFGRKHGVEVYDLVKRCYGPEEAVEVTELYRQGFKRYVNDWSSEDILTKGENSYEFTQKGEFFHKLIKYCDLGINLGMERVNELLEERDGE